ncbi:MAG: hypothetical protein FJ368_07310 [Pelagibacterales bacterium]|nr:hypothetical protein [Pelagibacterales bacterium]
MKNRYLNFFLLFFIVSIAPIKSYSQTNKTSPKQVNKHKKSNLSSIKKSSSESAKPLATLHFNKENLKEENIINNPTSNEELLIPVVKNEKSELTTSVEKPKFENWKTEGHYLGLNATKSWVS